MKRYTLNHWFIRVWRTAYRLETAAANAAEFVSDQDYASLHYEEGWPHATGAAVGLVARIQ